MCRCCVVLCFILYFGQLVDEARKQERLLWYTSMHPDTPLHTSLPLNTAVALPISLSVLRRDLCFVFFAEHDVNVSLTNNIRNHASSSGVVVRGNNMVCTQGTGPSSFPVSQTGSCLLSLLELQRRAPPRSFFIVSPIRVRYNKSVCLLFFRVPATATAVLSR